MDGDQDAGSRERICKRVQVPSTVEKRPTGSTSSSTKRRRWSGSNRLARVSGTLPKGLESRVVARLGAPLRTAAAGVAVEVDHRADS